MTIRMKSWPILELSPLPSANEVLWRPIGWYVLPTPPIYPFNPPILTPCLNLGVTLANNQATHLCLQIRSCGFPVPCFPPSYRNFDS